MSKTKDIGVALDVIDGQKTIDLPAELVTRVYTVAALGAWMPDVANPFENLKGTVTCNMRILAEAYIVAMATGWRPKTDDTVALMLLDLGILNTSTKTTHYGLKPEQC